MVSHTSRTSRYGCCQDGPLLLMHGHGHGHRHGYLKCGGLGQVRQVGADRRSGRRYCLELIDGAQHWRAAGDEGAYRLRRRSSRLALRLGWRFLSARRRRRELFEGLVPLNFAQHLKRRAHPERIVLARIIEQLLQMVLNFHCRPHVHAPGLGRQDIDVNQCPRRCVFPFPSL